MKILQGFVEKRQIKSEKEFLEAFKKHTSNLFDIFQNKYLEAVKEIRDYMEKKQFRYPPTISAAFYMHMITRVELMINADNQMIDLMKKEGADNKVLDIQKKMVSNQEALLENMNEFYKASFIDMME